MLDATLENLPTDVAIFSAAVADYKANKIESEKIKKGENLNLSLDASGRRDCTRNGHCSNCPFFTGIPGVHHSARSSLCDCRDRDGYFPVSDSPNNVWRT